MNKKPKYLLNNMPPRNMSTKKGPLEPKGKYLLLKIQF